jgi:putative transposase
MPQSFVQIYVHIVFHTKDNVKLISEDIENELFSYLGGILKNYKSIPLQIGGTSDHIHILCTLPKTMAQADLAEEVKKSSSKWIKTKVSVTETSIGRMVMVDFRSVILVLMQ